MQHQDNAPAVEQLIEAENLASMLKGEQFRQFLDKIPIALIVSVIEPRECIVYANSQFEVLTGGQRSALEGRSWEIVKGRRETDGCELSKAIIEGSEHIGSFLIEEPDAEAVLAEAYSNVIETEEGTPNYRLVALIAAGAAGEPEREVWEQTIRDKDFQLLELQHRVKNNLQMITALIRLESRSWPEATDALKNIAGRIEALQILYHCLTPDGNAQEVDLGAYLGQVAAAVMLSHASEGIRLAIEVDVCPVSINIAMPAGLVLNELITNALKYAFIGRAGGTITIQSLPDGDRGRKIVVADDGIGLPLGVEWPQKGKLSALFVQSLRENANARVDVQSEAGEGTRVTVFFATGAPSR